MNTWKEPKIILIRRNSENAVELAEFGMPKDIETRFLDAVGHHKGVYAIEGEVKDWLKGKLFNTV